MGYYPSGCENEIPVHNCDPCEAREFGRIRSAGFIHKDFVFANDDTTDVSEWERGIAANQIIVIPQTNGELSEPSEQVGAGYGDAVEQLLGYDFEAMFNDPNYSSNCDFYNAMIGKRNFKFFYRTSSKTHISPVTVTIIPKTKIDNELTSEVVWNVKLKWKASSFPCPIDTPAGVLETCYIPE